jgi:hypothetical protein
MAFWESGAAHPSPAVIACPLTFPAHSPPKTSVQSWIKLDSHAYNIIRRKLDSSAGVPHKPYFQFRRTRLQAGRPPNTDPPSECPALWMDPILCWIRLTLVSPWLSASDFAVAGTLQASQKLQTEALFGKTVRSSQPEFLRVSVQSLVGKRKWALGQPFQDKNFRAFVWIFKGAFAFPSL